MIEYKLNKYMVLENNVENFIYLGNCFPTLYDYGQFINQLGSKITSLIGTLGQTDNIIYDFFAKNSNKKISSFLDLMLLNYGIEKSDNHLSKVKYFIPTRNIRYEIGTLFEARYYNKWKKIIDTFNITYNPIKPYDMEINDDTSEKMDNNVLIKRLNESNSENESSDKVINDETDNSMYGFNSINPVPTDKSINKSENVSNDKNTYNSSGSTDTEQNKEVTNERVIKRLGNIGNIPQQELIKQELELRKIQILDIIFEDMSKVLTCGCY